MPPERIGSTLAHFGMAALTCRKVRLCVVAPPSQGAPGKKEGTG
jgi:hypothetical protein